MAFIKLQFKPGINRNVTNYTNEGGWYDADKVRFFSGFPQKIGGWVKQTTQEFNGVCRQMMNYVTSFLDNFLVLGTNSKLYIEVGGVIYNITPARATYGTTATDNCFATTNNSTTVTVDITAHGANTGDTVSITGSAAVGGVPADDLNQDHVIDVIDVDTFVITVDTAATSTVAAGGGTAITAVFEITPGNKLLVEGYGWGTGTYARGFFGLGSTVPVDLPQRDWWLDNFDNDIVATIRNGPIYYWERGANADAGVSLGTRAVLLSSLSGATDVPLLAMQTLVSQNDKHLLAFGCTPFGGGDPDLLLIRWSNQDEPKNFTPAVTNSAGFIRVSRGSRIVRALATRQEILVWTEGQLYSLQFLGTTDVFGLQELADNLSIVSPRACISVNNQVYWMGHDKFYAYTGTVTTLPCSVREFVFTDLNYTQADQIVCGTNEGYNEIWWFYPSGTSNWNDRYVVYNHLEQIWYFGSMERTAWLDSPLRDFPQGVTTGQNVADGNIFFQEYGVDSDGVAMESYIQSSDFDLGDGDQFMLSRRIIPDLNFSESEASEPEVKFQVRPRNFPGATVQEDISDSADVVESSVGVYTDQIYLRARARQMALKISSDGLGVKWQLGSPRIDVRSDGRR
jgi:hypothetical protein